VSQKVVLMMQPSQEQGKIWQAILNSQNISTIWESDDCSLIEIINNLNNFGVELPDLFLIDLDIKSMNPYAFCRWCREKCPKTKIILTKSSPLLWSYRNQVAVNGDRNKILANEISAAERRWALNQGAQDLLPGFRPDALLTGSLASLNRVAELLGDVSLNEKNLIKTLYNLLSQNKFQAQTSMSVVESEVFEPESDRESDSTNENNNLPQETITEAKRTESRFQRKYRGLFY
jgi:CheY-like chemotaxis protein